MSLTKIMVLISISMLLIPPLAIASSPQESHPTVQLIFDNKNATLNILINRTPYFTLSFSRLYIGTGIMPGMAIHTATKETLKNMEMRVIKSRNELMGNYTEVLMWKELKIGHGRLRGNEVNITLRFYIAEKSYYKKDVKIERNMLRYDVLIHTNSPASFFYLEEKMKFKGNQGKEVYEYSNNVPGMWKKLPKTQEIREHMFSGKHLGMIKFGNGSKGVQCLWENDQLVDTFYYYADSDFSLIFSFHNENGSIIYDPYITLPVPIYPSLQPIVGGVEKAVNYLMDHILSFTLGLIIAVFIVLSAPLIRKRR